MADGFVKFGDTLVIESEDSSFLSVDPVLLGVIWELPPLNSSAQPAAFDNCLWRITSRLSYIDDEMLKSSLSKGGRRQSTTSLSSNYAYQSKQEALRNQYDIDNNTSDVLYGMIVQLQHVATGLFLTGLRTSSLDSDCFQLRVEPGSANAYFKISPLYKIRTEGSRVVADDEITFSSLAIAKHFIHKSSRLRPGITSHGVLCDECNLSRSSAYSKMAVKIYGRVFPYQAKTLTTTQATRFLDCESNAFLQSSCDLRLQAGERRVAHLREIDRSIPFASHPDAMRAEALWCFESVGRKTCEYMQWSREYRIRHLATSLYLSVVRSDDRSAAGEGGEETCGYELALCPQEEDQRSQTFSILSMQPVGDLVATSDVMVQLRHSVGPSEYLFVRKARRAGATGGVFLGAQATSYDAFMLMDVKADISGIVTKLATYYQVAVRYAHYFVQSSADRAVLPVERQQVEYEEHRGRLAGGGRRYSASNVGEGQSEEEDRKLCALKMLKNLLFDVVIGDQDEADTNIYKMDGFCDSMIQNFCREHRMMEALLTMAVAPVQMKRIDADISNGNVGSRFPNEPLTFKSIHLLVWTVLKHLYKANFESEMYFVEQIDEHSLVIDGLPELASVPSAGGGQQRSVAMERMINQIPFRLGASNALTVLISNNRKLLERFVNADLLVYFRGLISEWGPVSNFMGVFRAICSCQGVAIPKNQDLCIDIIQSSTNENSFLVAVEDLGVKWPKAEGNNPMNIQGLSRNEKEEGGIRASTHLNFNPLAVIADKTGADSHGAEQASDEPYFGSACEVQGFPKVFVSWVGSDSWVSQCDTFYFSPERIGIKSEGVAGKAVVDIEALCFPEKFEEGYSLVLSSGEAAKDPSQKNNDLLQYYRTLGFDVDMEGALDMYLNHEKLALYFKEQVNFMAEMCLGRNQDAKALLSPQFSFDVVLSCMCNVNLPFGIRSAFTNMMLTLVVDQFPHQDNCGRNKIPFSVYLYSELRDKDLDDDDALPRFSIPESGGSSTDDMYKYITPKKLEFLVCFCAQYLSNCQGQQISDPGYRERNLCNLSVLKLARKLIVTGFYDTVGEIKNAVRPAMLLLDGRQMFDEHGKAPPPGMLPREEAGDDHARYKRQDETTDIIAAKQSILGMLQYVKGLRGQYRLEKFLNIFKEKKEYDWSMDKVVDHVMSVLAESGLNINALSGLPYTDTIFIDLLMYEDEDLFQQVLKVLLEEHEPAQALAKHAHNAYLICGDQLDPPMISFQHLNKCLFDLTFLFERPHTWGTRKIDPAKFREASNLLIKFRRYLYSASSLDSDTADEFAQGLTEPSKQTFMFSLNLQTILLQALQWDLPDPVRPVAQPLSWRDIEATPLPQQCSIHEIVIRSVVILHDMVCSKRRTEFAKFVPAIMESIDKQYLRKYLLKFMYQIYRGSAEHVSQTPEPIFQLYSSLLTDADHRDLALLFFEQQLCPGERDNTAVLRSQDLVCHELQEQLECFAVGEGSTAAGIARYISVVNLLSACCTENSHNSDAIRFVLPAKLLLKRMRGLVVVIKAHKTKGIAERDDRLALYVALLDSYCSAFIAVYLDEIDYDEEVVSDRRVISSVYDLLSVLYAGLFGDDNVEVAALVTCDSILELVSAFLAVSSSGAEALSLLAHQLSRNVVNTLAQDSKNAPRKSVLLQTEVSPFWSTTIVLCYRLLISLGVETHATLEGYQTRMHSTESASARFVTVRPPRVCNGDATSRKKLVLDSYLAEDGLNTLPPLTHLSTVASAKSTDSAQRASVSFLPEVFTMDASTLVGNEKVAELYTALKGCSLQDLRCSGVITCEDEHRVDQVATPFAEEETRTAAGVGLGFLRAATDGAMKGLSDGLSVVQEGASKGLELGTKGLELGLELGSLGLVKPKRMTVGLLKDLDLQNELSEFIDEVLSSAEFKKCIRKEKMKVISLFRSAKDLTDPADPKYLESFAATSDPSGKKRRRMSAGFQSLAKLAHFGSEAASTTELRRTKITWKDIIARMIAHIDYKNSRGEAGAEGSICSRIIDLFILYLDDAGTSDDAKYVERQDELNGFDLMHLVYRLLKSPGKGLLFESALVLGEKLLAGGHRGCQNSFLHYMRSSNAEDSDGQFFKNVHDTISDAALWVRKTQQKQSHALAGEGEVVREIEVVITTFRFLQGLCEGHIRAAQDCLREQPFNRRNYDIIGVANDLMEDLAPRRDIVKDMGYSQYCLLSALLSFVIDCVQGPCPQNQMVCVEKKAIEVCKQLITAVPRRISHGLRYQCRFKAICLLAALVEGRHDGRIERMLFSKIEMALFDELEKDLRRQKSDVSRFQIEKKKNKPYLSRNVLDLTVPADDDQPELSAAFGVEVETAVTDYFKVKVKLALEAEKNSRDGAVAVVGTADTDDSNIAKQIKKQMCEVEILWNGKVERVVFPIPPIASKLSETSKAEFLNNCDLSSRESRIKDLMENAEDFFDEMRVYHRLAQFPVYDWLLNNYFYFKSFILILVSMLVLNVLFSYSSDAPNIRDTRNKDSRVYSLILTIFSGVGYFVLVLYWVLPRIALSLFKHQEEKGDEEDNGGEALEVAEAEKDRDASAIEMRKIEHVSLFRRFKRMVRRSLVWRALKYPIFAFPALWFVFAMHHAAYVNEGGLTSDDLFRDYSLITIAVYCIWIPISVRSGIGETPKSIFEELYVLVYDTLMQLEIYEHLGCLLCLFFGSSRVYLYSLVLLDWISLSEHMKNVVRSVIRPFKALFSVFLLFCFVIIIFAVVGFFTFDHAFVMLPSDIEVGEDGGLETTTDIYCTSVMSCFWTIAYGAVRAGDIAEVMDEFSPADGSLYYSRLLFDMIFFIVLGVLLFDMVTGIIVDTFVALREETSEREDVMQNEVFISGITQEMCTDKGLSFANHQDKFQKTWNYIFYYAYLRLRNKNDLDGPELYVWDCICRKDCMWFPRMRSIAMDAAGSEMKGEDQFAEIGDRLSRLELLMEELIKISK